MFHRKQRVAPFGEWHAPSRPGQVIGLDFMVMTEKRVGQKRYVLTIVDLLSKVGEAWAFKGMGAKEVGEGLNKWVAMHGRPEVVCADASMTNQSEQV